MPVLREHMVDEDLICWRGRAADRQRDGTEAQLKQPVPAMGLEVILTLRRAPRDQLYLRIFGAEAIVCRSCLRLDRAVIRQEDPLRATFYDCRRDGAGRDVGERLGGEDDGDVLLAQDLQPFPDARREERVIEIDP